MLRYVISADAVEAMLQTGRKIEMVKGIPPDHRLVGASLHGSLLELRFDRADNFQRDEIMEIKFLE